MTSMQSAMPSANTGTPSPLADGETLMIDFYRQHLPSAEHLALP